MRGNPSTPRATRSTWGSTARCGPRPTRSRPVALAPGLVQLDHGRPHPAFLNVPSPGLHTVHVWAREDGISLDRLVLQTRGAGPDRRRTARERPRHRGGPDTTPPTLQSRTPVIDATDVAVDTDVTATFSEAIDPATISASSVTLTAGTTPVPATRTLTARRHHAHARPRRRPGARHHLHRHPDRRDRGHRRQPARVRADHLGLHDRGGAGPARGGDALDRSPGSDHLRRVDVHRRDDHGHEHVGRRTVDHWAHHRPGRRPGDVPRPRVRSHGRDVRG